MLHYQKNNYCQIQGQTEKFVIELFDQDPKECKLCYQYVKYQERISMDVLGWLKRALCFETCFVLCFSSY